MCVGAVADLFTTIAILLVGDRERRVGDGEDLVRVIKWGSVGPTVDFAIDGEVDVSELEALRTDVVGIGVGVLSRAQDPEESNDAEVDYVGVASSKLVAFRFVENFGELADDAHVARVGALLRVVVEFKGVVEIFE